MKQTPTEWEQDVAAMYVNKRKLVKPDTNINTSVVAVLMFSLVSGAFTWLLHHVLMSAGVFECLPSGLQVFCNAHPFWRVVIICTLVIVAELFFCLKYAVIGAIKLYQHYANEEVRRRCLFMPTCSEYAIMAVRKYGVLVGSCKSYRRIVHRCRGNTYRIDYP